MPSQLKPHTEGWNLAPVCRWTFWLALIGNLFLVLACIIGTAMLCAILSGWL